MQEYVSVAFSLSFRSWIGLACFNFRCCMSYIAFHFQKIRFVNSVSITQVASLSLCLILGVACFILFEFQKLCLFHFVWVSTLVSISDMASLSFCMNFRSGTSSFGLKLRSSITFILFEFQKKHLFHFGRLTRIWALSFCLGFTCSIAWIVFAFPKLHLFHFVWMSDVACCPFGFNSGSCVSFILCEFENWHVSRFVGILEFQCISFYVNTRSLICFILFEFQQLHLFNLVSISQIEYLSFCLTFRRCIFLVMFNLLDYHYLKWWCGAFLIFCDQVYSCSRLAAHFENVMHLRDFISGNDKMSLTGLCFMDPPTGIWFILFECLKLRRCFLFVFQKVWKLKQNETDTTSETQIK